MKDLGDARTATTRRPAPQPKPLARSRALSAAPQSVDEKADTSFAADKVRFFRIEADEAGQRIDNFLLRLAKGVPKSHVYRVIREGEVRVNKRKVDITYRLEPGDELRLPPMRTAERAPANVRPAEFPILFEDDHLLAVDKPAGVAVHGGSGVSYGVIEQLRAARPKARFLELVHRLDRDTSGVLLLAKKRSALTAVHEQMREGRIEKRYLALVSGDWQNTRQHVRLSLVKYLSGNAENGGERRVRTADPDDSGALPSHTVFSLREKFDTARGRFALIEAELKTGRTHQIRVHLASLGFPIAGDDKYGDFGLNKELGRPGGFQLKRMFLHAWEIVLIHPWTGATLKVDAALPDDCLNFLDALGPRRQAGQPK